MKRLIFLCVIGLCVFVSSACGLQAGLPNVGIECDDAGDCDDDELGCVPLDDEDLDGDKICMPPPEDWVCQPKFYGDGACDCGCEVLDIDCTNDQGASCAADGDQCASGTSFDPTDNTQCI